MALNIKNEETCALIEDLARATGENMTTAITGAVREKLDRLHRQRRKGVAKRLVEIGKDCAAHLREPYRSIDHGEMLYDENGLPR